MAKPGRKKRRPDRESPNAAPVVNGSKGGARRIRRDANDFPNGWCYSTTLRWDVMTKMLLELHAKQRGVDVTTIVCDIINGWLTLCTDYKQDYFRVQIPQGMRHPDVPERWLGYLESLGYSPVVHMQDPSTPGAGYDEIKIPAAPIHDVPPPPDDVRAWKPGDAIVGHAVPADVPLNVQQGARAGVGVFNPEEHRKVAAAAGHGSAAQEYVGGKNPAGVHPDDLLRRT